MPRAATLALWLALFALSLQPVVVAEARASPGWSEDRASSPASAAPAAGVPAEQHPAANATHPSAAIIAEDRELPWNDVIMVVILLLAFTGGTVAIIRSSRKR